MLTAECVYEFVDPHQSPISCALADENDDQLFDLFSGLNSDFNFDFWGSSLISFIAFVYKLKCIK